MLYYDIIVNFNFEVRDPEFDRTDSCVLAFRNRRCPENALSNFLWHVKCSLSWFPAFVLKDSISVDIQLHFVDCLAPVSNEWKIESTSTLKKYKCHLSYLNYITSYNRKNPFKKF